MATMKYKLGIKLLVSFIVGGIAILYKYRINPKNNSSEFSSIIKVPRPFLFNLVTDLNNVPQFFTWVTELHEVDLRKNISMGKAYFGRVRFPYFGEFNINYKISEVKHGQWIILKPDPVKDSWMKAEIIVMLNSITTTETQFYVKIVYHRTSLLFQLTLAPFFKSLTDEQLQQTYEHLNELAMYKWKKWQATNLTKPKTTGSSSSTK